MPAPRKVSPRQLELLLEFAEEHRDIALGRFAGGPLASQAVQQVWNELADKLNAVTDGTTRTPHLWRRYWIEFKYKTRNKAADIRRSASATGRGLAPLTEIEERVLELMRSVPAEALPGVRIPLDIPSTSPSLTPEPSMEVEWLDEDILSRLGLDPSQPPNTSQGPATTSVPESAAPVPTPTPSPEPSNQQHTAERAPTPVHSSPGPRPRRVRPRRQLRQAQRISRWAYNLAKRRLAIEERDVAVKEQAISMEQRRLELQERDIQSKERFREGVLKYLAEIVELGKKYKR